MAFASDEDLRAALELIRSQQSAMKAAIEMDNEIISHLKEIRAELDAIKSRMDHIQSALDSRENAPSAAP